MTSVYRWTAKDKKRLLACHTEAEMAAAFPDKTLGNLLRRRTEFAKERSENRSNTVKTKAATLVRVHTEAENGYSDFDLSLNEQETPYTPTVRNPTGSVTHVVIPDTQAGPGRPTDHLNWIGQYLVEQFSDKPNVKIVHIGDHADMPSLSSYDRGKKSMENRRVHEDIFAANTAFEVLNQPLTDYNRTHKKKWNPEKHITLGNHEDRITRAVEEDAQMENLLTLDLLNYTDLGWNVYPFLKPHFMDGIGYAHYFANPMTGKPYGGMASTRLKTIGTSFIMGHQQTLDYAVRFVAGRSQHALIAGACYLHNESYKGYQGNAHWRGIVVCHDVQNGSFDPMFVSLDYLCRRYEGMEVSKFMQKKYKMSYNGGWN